MKKICLAFFFLFISAGFIYSQAPTGKIFGSVVDEQGTALPGVTVEATSPKLIGKATAISDEKGVYRVFALTPGLYKVTFVLQGFKTVTRDGIIVEVEQSVKLNVALPLGAIEEEVTVIGRSPLIDVKSTVKGITMTKEVFGLLPRGRDFDTLLGAVPGVQNEPMLSGISVDGASGAENMFYVDGTDITNLYIGTRGQGVAFEFVDEVQVKASGYQAEYGGSLGGVIHVITRQGGNSFHGDVLGYYSGSRLNGKERDTLRLNPYDINVAEYINYQDLYGKDKVDRVEAGFNFGGYIFKDRLWLFGSFLPVYNTTTRHVKFEPSLIEGDYTRRDYFWNFQAKLTSQPFQFVRLGASFVSNFNNYKGDLPPRDGTGSPTDRWSDYGYRYPYWTAAAYADFTFGNNLLFSLRGGSFYNNTTDQLVQPTEPRYTHGGMGNSVFPNIPTQYIRPRGWANMPGYALNVTEKRVAQKSYAGGDLTYYLNFAGEHAWKFGAQWVRTAEDWKVGFKYPDYPSVGLNWNRPFIYLGQNYGRGTYGYYTVIGNETTGPNGFFYNVHSDRWTLYLQDSWTIEGRLTLNLGLRTEREYIPSYSNDPALKGVKPIDFSFGDKLAPRLGFVYDIFGDANLKVFGSYGLYYDVMKLYYAAMVFGGRKSVGAAYTLDTYEWDKIGKNGYYPGTLMRTVDFAPASDIADPSIKPMSQREISFGVEKKLVENLSATVRLVQKHLLYTIEDVGVISGGDVTFYLANPGYGYSRSTADGGKFDARYPTCPKAKREYWGLNFSLDKRLSDRWLGGFSYTWSRLTGNYSGLASSDEYNAAGEGRNSPNAERNFDTWYYAYDKNLNPIDGVLATDRPHVFKLYGAYTFPFRLTVGAVVAAMSGRPMTEYWTIYLDNYMPYNRGNLGRTPFLWIANFYAEYSLRMGKTSLSFNVNVDNVFDTSTTTAYFPFRNLFDLTVTEDQILSKDWELDESVDYVPNNLFRMKGLFFPPVTARLGLRFSF
ncbi:MAG: TonB-dependent receptor [Candidatus Aminicenantes bacterium]|nr:TonB-dependent receptor [Candidatus Aminicenantes bacterium]